jgi:hypothetical protein
LSFIIKRVFGVDEAVLIFLILALPESVNKLGFPLYNFLLGIGKANFLAILQIINLAIISGCVYMGLEITHSSIGLLGYWVSVIVGNMIIMWYSNKITSISMWAYLIFSKAIKLVLLDFLLLLSIWGIYKYNFNVYIFLAVLCGLSVLIFYKDIKILIVRK